MAVVPADIRTLAPEFAALADGDIQPWIDMAERRTNRPAWGVKADDGITFLTLHWLSIRAQAESAGSGGGGAGMIQGPITSETVGPLSRSYAVVSAASSGAPYTEGWYTLSSWGLAYAELRRTVFADRVGCL